MKKYYLLLFLTLACLSACNDLLDEKNKSNPVPGYLSTPAGFEDAVKGSYSFLRSFYATERGMTLTVFGTDEFTMGSDGNFKFVNQYTAQFDPRTSILSELWVDFYRGINAANAAIGRADQIAGLDANAKKVRVAEARFLRAQFYFLLVQMFGPVELKLTETTEVSTESKRSTVPQIYAAIVQDLTDAVADLPGTNDQGRATKPAAQHLLARVHLTRATMDNTVQASDEYQKAADLANAVITNPAFALLPDYAQVFEQGAGEVNREVVWSVQYTSDPLTNSTGNNAHTFFLMEYDVQPGMTRDVKNGRPFKRFKPTNYTLSLWNRALDSRYTKNFKQVFLCNKPGTYTIPVGPNPAATDPNAVVSKSVTFNLGDTTMWLPGTNLTFAQQNAKPFQVIIPSEYTVKLYPSLTKFLDPMRPDVTTFEGSRDFLAFRLAETYLIRAEALFYLNNSADAAAMINVVRRRAAFPGKEVDMEIVDTDITPDFILDERARELLGEQLRWFDLVRTHTLVSRVKLYNADAKDNIQDHHVLRPVPQDQIDRTKNSDGTPF
jgi:hypothetical protein